MWYSCSLRFAVKRRSAENSIRFISSELQKVEQEIGVDKLWMTSIDVKKCLQHSLTKQPSKHIIASDITNYLLLRGYSSSEGPNSSAVRVLSSIHTFPLSLSYGIRKIYQFPMTHLSVLMIGARSESSLPSQWLVF